MNNMRACTGNNGGGEKQIIYYVINYDVVESRPRGAIANNLSIDFETCQRAANRFAMPTTATASRMCFLRVLMPGVCVCIRVYVSVYVCACVCEFSVYECVCKCVRVWILLAPHIARPVRRLLSIFVAHT